MKFILIPGHQIVMICDAPSASYADTQSTFGAVGSHDSPSLMHKRLSIICFGSATASALCIVSRLK